MDESVPLQASGSAKPFEFKFKSSQPNNPFQPTLGQRLFSATGSGLVLHGQRAYHRPRGGWTRAHVSSVSPSPPSSFKSTTLHAAQNMHPPACPVSISTSSTQGLFGVVHFRGLAQLEPQPKKPQPTEPEPPLTTNTPATIISFVDTEPKSWSEPELKSEPESETDLGVTTSNKPPDHPSPARSASEPPTEAIGLRRSQRLQHQVSSSQPEALAPAQPLHSVKRQAQIDEPGSTPRKRRGNFNEEPDSSSPKTKYRTEDIDFAIAKKLAKPSKPNYGDKNQGYVYVAPAEHNGNKVVKIGVTTRTDPNDRIGEIESECGSSGIRFLPRKYDLVNVKYYYQQVEQLTQKELGNFRYDFDCSCSNTHREYFAVDEKTGRDIVTRWAKFCSLDPYVKPTGCKLKKEWILHLGRFREKHYGTGGEDQEKKDDHVKRGERWGKFVNSQKRHWFWKKAWALRWELLSMVSSGALVIQPSGWLRLILLVFTVYGHILRMTEMGVEEGLRGIGI